MKKKNGEGKYHGEGKIVADLGESKALRAPRGPKNYLKRLALILKGKNICKKDIHLTSYANKNTKNIYIFIEEKKNIFYKIT